MLLLIHYLYITYTIQPKYKSPTGLCYTTLRIKHNVHLFNATATPQNKVFFHYLPLPSAKHWLAQKFIQLNEDGEQTCVSARTRHQKDVFAL